MKNENNLKDLYAKQGYGRYPKNPSRYDSYIKADEEKGIKRLNNSNRLLTMDISIEPSRSGGFCYIEVKDRAKEKIYSMILDKDVTISKSCEIAIMFIEKFKIREVYTDGTIYGQKLNDCLLTNLRVHNINWCNIVHFTYEKLEFDTIIYNN